MFFMFILDKARNIYKEFRNFMRKKVLLTAWLQEAEENRSLVEGTQS